MDSRTKLLVGALAFVGLFGVWIWIGPGGTSDGETAPSGPVPGVGRPAASRAVEHVEEPLFATLLAVRPRERVPGRDPWRYGVPSQPVQLAKRSISQPVPEPVPPAQPAPAPATTKPAPPAFPWKYLGSFGPADRRIAVFSEGTAGGSAVHNRREGEVLAERFVLERIGIESVDVRPLHAPGAPAQRLVPGAAAGAREDT